MTLKVRFLKTNIGINLLQSEPPTNEFMLVSENKEIQISIPFTLSEKGPSNLDDFKMYLLYKKDPPESEIFQVYKRETEKRIGWIFPLQSLLSQEHRYAKDKYFLEYANIALKKLILDSENFEEKIVPEYDSTKKYSLLDFYPDNLIVFLLKKSFVPELNDSWIGNYAPALFRHGYSKNINVKLIDTSDLLDTHDELDLPGESTQEEVRLKKKIKISPIRKEVKDNVYIELLIDELSKDNINPLLEFHLLYQIIELLIGVIYSQEIQKLVEDKVGLSAMEPHKLVEKLHDIADDSKRVKSLFVRFSGHTEEFKEVYRQFFGGSDLPKLNLGEMIYSVRNYVVHHYHTLTAFQKVALPSVNLELESIILDLLNQS